MPPRIRRAAASPGIRSRTIFWARCLRPTRARAFSNGLLRASVFSLYCQDTWKITPKLTAELGLRYENTPPYHDKYRGIINVIVYDSGVYNGALVPGREVPGHDPARQRRLSMKDCHSISMTASRRLTGDDLLGRETVKRDNNDFAPRISLAYRPSEHGPFAPALGMFYVQDIVEAAVRSFPECRWTLAIHRRFGTAQRESERSVEVRRRYVRNWTGPCQGPTFTLANNTNRRTPYHAAVDLQCAAAAWYEYGI